MPSRFVKILCAVALCAPFVSRAAVFTSDFNSGQPGGTIVSGSAFVGGGALKITVNANGQQGNFFLPDFAGGSAITNFQASFNLALGGGNCCGPRMADGMSFVMGSDLSAGSAYGEDGCCNGISVTFDTWDNAAPDTAPALDVRVANSIIAFQSMGTLGGALREGGRAPDGPVLTNSLGQEVQIFTFGPDPAPVTFVPVSMELFSDNTFSMSFSNVVVWNHLPMPSYTPVAGANWGFGARTGGANENAWIDDLQIFANFAAGPAILTSQPVDQTVTESQTATFSVQVNGTPVYFFQWFSNDVAIAGGTGQSYTTPPTTTGMSGTMYKVAVSNALSGGVAVVSSSALLTVNAGVFAQSASSEGRTNGVHVRFSKNVALSGTYTLNNGATVNSAAYGATHRDVLLTTTMLTPDADYTLTVNNEVGEDASALIPNPSVLQFHHGFGALCTTFASLPAGTALFNNGVTGAGLLGDDGTGTNTVVHLNDDGNNGAYGKFYISNRTGSSVLTELQATWRMRIGGALNGHADGFSLNWANNIAANGNFVAAEGGEGTGVTFIIDTWDGGSGPGTGMEIRWQGTRLNFLHIPRTDEGDGNFICRDEFVNVSASVNSAGSMSFTYNGNTITGTIPSWPGITAGVMAWEARTGGEDDNMWIDDLCVNNFTLGPLFFTKEPVETTALEGTPATFTAAVDGSPAYGFQWRTNGVPVPGANFATYTTSPATAAMEGLQVSVTVSNAFSSVTSSNAPLHVKLSPRVLSVFSHGTRDVHVIFTRGVDLNSGFYDFDNGAFEATRRFGTNHNEVIVTTDSDLIVNTTYTVTVTDVNDEFDGSNVQFPNPTVKTFRQGYGQYCNDFAADQAAGTTLGPVTLYGNAYVSGGVLHITDNVNGQGGTAIIEDQNAGLPLDRFQLRYRSYIGGGGGNPADGYSVSIGTFPNAAIGGGEEGQGIGLTVAFDNFDNGGGEAPAIDIKWNNSTIAHTLTSVMRSDVNAGIPGTPVFLNNYINLDPDGTLDVIVNGVAVYYNLPTPFTGFIGARVGFAGRTGGLNEANWIDDLCINAFALGGLQVTQQPADAAVNENPPQSVTFSVDVSGVTPYGIQWYSNGVPVSGATGFVYTTPPLNRTASGAGYTAIISNFDGSVTSRTAVVTVVQDGAAPIAISASSDCNSHVYVEFSEVLAAGSANASGNYTIDHGVGVTAAQLDPSGRRVILTVSPNINPNDCDTLTINGVTDSNAFPNPMINFKIKIAAKAPVEAGPNALIVVEAEDFDINRSPGLFWAANNTANNSWVFGNTFTNFAGTGYMDAAPNNAGFSGNTADGITNALRLDYCINFPVSGTYYAWFRGASHANDGSRNSLHFGLDGVIPDEFTLRVGNRVNNWGGTANLDDFGWVNDVNGTNVGSVAQIVVPTPGLHTINIWMREAGFTFDRFLLTTNSAFTVAVSDIGPAATPRTPTRNVRLVRALDGSVTILWAGTGWVLQATDKLNLNPAATAWQTLPFPSGTVIPPGYFGTGNTNVTFRLICP